MIAEVEEQILEAEYLLEISSTPQKLVPEAISLSDKSSHLDRATSARVLRWILLGISWVV
jgi:hypothetical protein